MDIMGGSIKSSAKTIAVIPARYASTRLPAKILADIHGKPMIQWVYERVIQARGLSEVWIATDDSRIEEAARRFGARVMMTSADLQSGTDRVAAVADRVEGDIFVNVQGDEPLMDPVAIEKAADLIRSGRFGLATLMTPLQSVSELDDPSVVKVIADRAGRAIYFSRHPIPYSRGARPENARELISRRHLGLYAFDRATLMRFRSLPPSAMERAEMLEQLRALDDGIAIGIAEVETAAVGVDTPEDLERVRRILKGNG